MGGAGGSVLSPNALPVSFEGGLQATLLYMH